MRLNIYDVILGNIVRLYLKKKGLINVCGIRSTKYCQLSERLGFDMLRRHRYKVPNRMFEHPHYD